MTQHSPVVQVAAVHVTVPGSVIKTLDTAAHPAKPMHVAAECGGKKANAEKTNPKWDNKNHSCCYQRRLMRKGGKLCL